jgi:hypothetical protein
MNHNVQSNVETAQNDEEKGDSLLIAPRPISLNVGRLLFCGWFMLLLRLDELT